VSDHYFISYSALDALDFSLKLANQLKAGPPLFRVWFDKSDLRPADDWDEQIVEAIRACKALIFVMTTDSVNPLSVCKQEWSRALKYKKPIIPLLWHREAEMPFRLGSRQHINFTGDYDAALANLRLYLQSMDTPQGQLLAFEHRLADAQRDLPRAQPEDRPRIQEEIAELQRQIEQQKAIIANPQAAQQRVQQSIDLGLERVRQPAQSTNNSTQAKFVNPPPLVAPTWFQDRHVETQLIGGFLKEEGLRVMTIVGRGGVGKSALTCRLLRSLEAGQLPDDGGPLPVDGIVYLSDARSSHRVSVPDLFAGLGQLLPEEKRQKLEAVYKNPQANLRDSMQAICEAFPQGRTVVLLDNFEDEVAIETASIKSGELADALRALLELPPHGVKLIITTRVAPRDLALIEPSRQRRLDLDNGLEHPYAENVLRAMDVDGKIGLRNAPEALLAEARERTRGYPRALEHLFGILSADRDASLQEILDKTRQMLPENVVNVLVGEAFSRLDPTAQRVMQALAIYRYPVPPAAVDFLLQPFVQGVDSAPVLSRLVNMQFVRREAGRYYLHQIDRGYADSRIPTGKPADRDPETPPWTRFALQHRAAKWFNLSRKPREAWKKLDDLAPQFAEFELRYAGEDYDEAALVLLDFDYECLLLWGHYRLLVDFHSRLAGKIGDRIIAESSAGDLGTGYRMLGEFEPAKSCYERALQLALETNNRIGLAAWSGGLGNCYAELGQIEKAIEFDQQALDVFRELANARGEAGVLGNLGNRYAELGQTTRAIDYCQQALKIFRELNQPTEEALNLANLGNRYADLGNTAEALGCYNSALALARQTGYRLIEAAALNSLGEAYSQQGLWQKASSAFMEAIEIADDTVNTQFQQLARLGLASAKLYQEDLAGARETAEAAGRFSFPLDDHRSHVLLGVIAYRQGDRLPARHGFAAALKDAGDLLARSPQLVAALETKALALCGLALCENPALATEAEEAYRTARTLSSDAGLVRRALRIFDTLAQADTSNILMGVRAFASGENRVSAVKSAAG